MTPRKGTKLPGIVLAAALVAAPAARVAHAANEVPIRLMCATYASEATAKEALEALKGLEGHGGKVVSYALLSKGGDGSVRVVEQRQPGTRAGNVVAGVVGLLGGPVGPAVGPAGPEAYLTGDVVGLPKSTVDAMRIALHPSESTLVTVVEETGADAARALMEARAERVESVPVRMPNKRVGPARQPGPQIPPTPAYP
jgi:hypothetical protein